MTHSIQGNNAVLHSLKRTVASSCRVTLKRDGDRPLQFEGKLVGENSFDPEWRQGTQVSIYETKKGRIITSVRQWQHRESSLNPGETYLRERNRAEVHDTPEEAYRWLLRDSGGRLGRSSKEAWDQACMSSMKMRGSDVEFVE